MVSTSSAAGTLYWELVTAISGMNVSGYSCEAYTAGDSTASSNPRTAFMVQTRALNVFWNSPPDSGYSVDNLPPASPAAFAGAWTGGTTVLAWNANTESDLAGYRVYRGATPGFVAGPASLVASTTRTTFADATTQPWFYKLTATDAHGNESAPVALLPAGTAGVGDTPAIRDLALAPASPNPASCGTSLRFALPVAANASLSVYDASGRRVRSLVSGPQAAGERSAAWDLRDANGRIVGAGLYFARLDAGGRSLVRRIAVTP
jgi:hypothetical protein